MKKQIIFLISLVVLIFSSYNVEAQTQGFYQGQYIPNIFIHKKAQNNIIYFNQARFIQKNNTNEIAYCVDPKTYFKDGAIYTETQSLPKFSQEQIEEMTLISHFGYGYKNHKDPKWYPITQTLIWEIADNTMKYHMTTSKNPNTDHLFINELNEIKNLVNNYKKSTSLKDKKYTIVEGTSLELIDTNNMINNYTSKDNIEINNNKIIIKNLKLGQNTITLEKNHLLYNKHPLFYTSNNSQTVMDLGDPYKIEEKFYINVINTEVNIKKIDYDTKTELPQGNASLSGATFNLYKEDNSFIKEIKLDKTNITIKNLNFGKYYLKEIKAGEGYKLNENKIYFELTENNPIIKLEIPNEVIKAKLTIKKEYGTDNNFIPETNISFNIYNNKNILIKTIITDKLGIAEIELPYGKYYITQLTTTEGYNKIEPITFEINSNKAIIYSLKDYKIDVPNTYNPSIIKKLIEILKEILWQKK